MGSVIFVHGTGVREEGYNDSLAKIRARLGHNDLRVAPCLWGEAHGVSLRGGGASIPDFDATRSIAQSDEEDKDLALWAALYGDPLCELRLLQSKTGPSAGFVPNRVTAYQQLDPLLRRLRPADELAARRSRRTDSAFSFAAERRR